MGKLIVVVGGQYGSEGKGLIAGYLAAREAQPLLAIRVAGPNAGHSVYDSLERKWSLQQVPVAAVTNSKAELRIAAGSEVDPELLLNELSALDDAGSVASNRMLVDSQATVLEQKHSLLEYGGQSEHGAGGLTRAVGSTGKGVGAARAERIWRRARVWSDLDLMSVDVALEARGWLRAGHTVMVEGTQGFGLGLHAGFYPYCTSSDCRAIDFLSMVGLSPWDPAISELEVWVVLRTYPIRVAGNSGPMNQETTWEALHHETDGRIPLEGELTTVTKKVRRVGLWDGLLARRAIASNGDGSNSVKVALTFLDYVTKASWFEGLGDAVRAFESSMGHRINLYSTGPHLYDVNIRREEQ